MDLHRGKHFFHPFILHIVLKGTQVSDSAVSQLVTVPFLNYGGHKQRSMGYRSWA